MQKFKLPRIGMEFRIKYTRYTKKNINTTPRTTAPNIYTPRRTQVKQRMETDWLATRLTCGRGYRTLAIGTLQSERGFRMREASDCERAYRQSYVYGWMTWNGWDIGVVVGLRYGLIVCLRDVCWISWALRRLYGGSRSREDARCRTGEIGSCSEVVGRRGVQCMHNLVHILTKRACFICFFLLLYYCEV